MTNWTIKGTYLNQALNYFHRGFIGEFAEYAKVGEDSVRNALLKPNDVVKNPKIVDYVMKLWLAQAPGCSSLDLRRGILADIHKRNLTLEDWANLGQIPLSTLQDILFNPLARPKPTTYKRIRAFLTSSPSVVVASSTNVTSSLVPKINRLFADTHALEARVKRIEDLIVDMYAMKEN